MDIPKPKQKEAVLLTATIMGSISDSSRAVKRLLAASLFLFLGIAAYAQVPRPGQLGAEIQRLERQLASGATPAQRHETLTRLARLRQLSGDLAGAAANWFGAVEINPADDTARVAGAYCLAATGEWENAALQLQPILISGRRGAAVLQAFYLDACLRAWISGDASTLVSLSANSDFISLHPIIYFTLWRTIARNPGSAIVGSAELWRSRLLAEFPNSPEARAALAESAGASFVISIVQGPVWLLFPGNAGSAAVPVLPPPPVAPPPVIPVNPPAAASYLVLQTGAFSTQANAEAQAVALRRVGFPAAVTRKQVNGAERWTVTVPVGQDSARTQQELKKAGFDSFPVRN